MIAAPTWSGLIVCSEFTQHNLLKAPKGGCRILCFPLLLYLWHSTRPCTESIQLPSSNFNLFRRKRSSKEKNLEKYNPEKFWLWLC